MVGIADGGCGVEASDLWLGWVGSKGLFHFRLFGFGVAVTAGGLAVELLGRELNKGELRPDGDEERHCGCRVGKVLG